MPAGLGEAGVVEACFAEPRLAVIYGHLDADRGDLDAYVETVEELSHDWIHDQALSEGRLTEGEQIDGMKERCAAPA